MIRRVRSSLIQYKGLLENFSFLSILQVSNLLIFLLITPYLFRILGKENYGLVVFSQTIAAYFSIIVNFGFNVTATRDISIHRDNAVQSSIIVSTVLTIKSLLFVISFFTLCILIIFIPLFNKHPAVFLFSMFFTMGEALFPIWYFQGIERMKYIAVINIISRILASCLIFALIKESVDYMKVPLVLGIGTVMGAILGLLIVFKKYHNRYIVVPLSALMMSLKENVPLFVSNVSSQIYVNANKLIVGSFLGMQDVAVYDIVDKIVSLLKVPVLLLGQTLFPRISRDKDVSFVKKTMIFVFVFFSVVYTGVFIFADPIILFFSGSTYPNAEVLLRILALSLLPICLGLFFAELLLIPFGKLKDYARMRAFSLFLYLIIIGLLIKSLQISLNNLAITIIIVEGFVFLYSYYLSKKNKLI